MDKNTNNCASISKVFTEQDFVNGKLFYECNDNGLESIAILSMPPTFHIDIKVGINSNLKVSILNEKEFKNSKFTAKCMQDSHLLVYFADFSSNTAELETMVELLDENAECIWNLASLSKGNDKKKFDISLNHLSKKTFSNINNFGVARENSKLVFSGICKIFNGCSYSKAHQNAKIIVFDEGCDAVAKPILKIDENSIEASHAAVVGKINDEQLFYLTSRGISVNAARELITLGYLKPIASGFDTKEMQDHILSLIYGGL